MMMSSGKMDSAIYLDFAATTPCMAQVVNVMNQFHNLTFANPSSPHSMGKRAMAKAQQFNREIVSLINCDRKELTLTSGATESNNIVILGCTSNYKGKNIVVCPIDHKSTLAAAQELEKRGIEIRYMKVDVSGLIDLDYLQQIVDTNTLLVTMALVNSEVGTLQTLEPISQILLKHPALFHVDASQAIGKIKLDLAESHRIDCLSFSAHKIGGPKGIGALFVRSAALPKLRPITFGGGQYTLRSGTLPVQLLAGFATATKIIKQQCEQTGWKNAQLRQSTILKMLESKGVEFVLNSSPQSSVPHILNVSFPGVRSETLILGLPHVCVSSGSACNSKSLKPSYVLTTLGHSDDRANCAIRISFSSDMNIDQIKQGAELLATKVKNLQALMTPELV